MRKTHADLKKEVKKQEDANRKDTEELRKQKKILEEELRTATMENRNFGDEKSTMADVLKCLKELLGNKVEENRVHAELGARKKYSCVKCEYEGTGKESLEKHMHDKHSEEIKFHVIYVIENLQL